MRAPSNITADIRHSDSYKVRESNFSTQLATDTAITAASTRIASKRAFADGALVQTCFSLFEASLYLVKQNHPGACLELEMP